EEVRMFTGIDVAELAVSRDNIGRDQVITGEAVLARQPANATTQGEASDACVCIGAPRGGQAKSLRLVVECPPRDAALGTGRPPSGVNPYAAHPGQVNDEAAIAHCRTWDVVATAAHRHQQMVGAGEMNAGDDI